MHGLDGKLQNAFNMHELDGKLRNAIILPTNHLT